MAASDPTASVINLGTTDTAASSKKRKFSPVAPKEVKKSTKQPVKAKTTQTSQPVALDAEEVKQLKTLLAKEERLSRPVTIKEAEIYVRGLSHADLKKRIQDLRHRDYILDALRHLRENPESVFICTSATLGMKDLIAVNLQVKRGAKRLHLWEIARNENDVKHKNDVKHCGTHWRGAGFDMKPIPNDQKKLLVAKLIKELEPVFPSAQN